MGRDLRPKAPTYYLTIHKNGEEIIRREPFGDFCLAVAFTSRFYRPRSRRSVLAFTTEVINGEHARSYAELARPEAVELEEPYHEERYIRAVKLSNAFDFENSYFFLIETDHGIDELESYMSDEGEVE